MNNPLWDFSLELYAGPEVAAVCIEAQDRCAADVNLLLYAAWLSRQDLELDQSQWRALENSVAEWRQRVIQPLRSLRRDWQTLPSAAALREQVKALELAAEMAQQAEIFAWHRRQAPQPAQPAQPDSLARALAQLLEFPAGQEDSDQRALLARLLTLLS